MLKNIFAFFGFLVIIAALYVGIVFEYKHFYEFLLIGILCILNAACSLSILTLRQHVKLYVYFFVAGLIVDLLLGLYLTKLWYYNYNFFYEYALLYIIIYPLGGYVMVWSYLFFQKHLGLTSVDRKICKNARLVVISMSVLVVMISFLSKPFLSEGVWSYMFGSIAVLCAIFFTIAIYFKNIKNTYFGYLIANPFKVLITTVLVVYSNMFLHELPNVVARQWVYTVTTGTIVDNLVLGIPIGLWILWPTLLIGPLVIYDGIRRSHQKP